MLIIGIAVRVILMPFTGHPFDVFSWYHMAVKLDYDNIYGFDSFFPVPLWPLTLFFVHSMYGLFAMIIPASPVIVDSLPADLRPGWAIPLIPDSLFLFLLKCPAVGADVAMAFILRRLFRDNNISADRVSKAWFLNPFVIWVSAGWGMFDSIPAFFTILSLYYAQKSNSFGSATALGLGVLYKIFPLMFAIPNVISCLRGKHQRYKQSAIFIATLAIILSPFASSFFGYNGFFQNWTGTPSTSFFGRFGFGLTYWSVSLIFGDSFDLGTGYAIMFAIMAIVTSVTLYVTIFKIKYQGVGQFAVAYVLLICSVFLSYRYVQEQWFIWLFPLLLILREHNIIGKWPVIGLTAISFVYSHKNFPFYLLPAYPFASDIINAFSNFAKLFLQRNNSTDWTILYPPPPESFEAILPNLTGSIILSILGCAFAAVLALIFGRLVWKFIHINEDRINIDRAAKDRASESNIN